MTHRTTGIPKVTPIQRGMIALLKQDYPRALEFFMVAYQSPKWQIRDAAVTALGDLLDSRVVDQSKQPSIMLVTNWQPPRILSEKHKTIPDDRMMILLEAYLQPALWEPRSIQEYKTLRALHSTAQFLQRVLVNEAHYLVRFSTLLVLTELIGADKRHFILATLQRAHRQEPDPLLKAAIAEFLPRTSS
jgi:hypothetical protein